WDLEPDQVPPFLAEMEPSAARKTGLLGGLARAQLLALTALALLCLETVITWLLPLRRRG
ncbi:MAG: hypothetical protein ABIG68_10695, partial [Acidobacteriota bacterium]